MMNMDKGTLKVFFGLMVFAFSLALAYFSASYVQAENLMDYWTMLVIFAGAFVVAGIVVYHVYPVSLGFLFSADILILHLLFENFGDITPISKTLILGVVLVLLYAFAWHSMKDDPAPPMAEPPAPPQPTAL